jgi:hypothetical protein
MHPSHTFGGGLRVVGATILMRKAASEDERGAGSALADFFGHAPEVGVLSAILAYLDVCDVVRVVLGVSKATRAALGTPDVLSAVLRDLLGSWEGVGACASPEAFVRVLREAQAGRDLSARALAAEGKRMPAVHSHAMVALVPDEVYVVLGGTSLGRLQSDAWLARVSARGEAVKVERLACAEGGGVAPRGRSSAVVVATSASTLLVAGGELSVPGELRREFAGVLEDQALGLVGDASRGLADVMERMRALARGHGTAPEEMDAMLACLETTVSSGDLARALSGAGRRDALVAHLLCLARAFAEPGAGHLWSSRAVLTGVVDVAASAVRWSYAPRELWLAQPVSDGAAARVELAGGRRTWRVRQVDVVGGGRTEVLVAESTGRHVPTAPTDPRMTVIRTMAANLRAAVHFSSLPSLNTFSFDVDDSDRPGTLLAVHHLSDAAPPLAGAARLWNGVLFGGDGLGGQASDRIVAFRPPSSYRALDMRAAQSPSSAAADDSASSSSSGGSSGAARSRMRERLQARRSALAASGAVTPSSAAAPAAAPEGTSDAAARGGGGGGGGRDSSDSSSSSSGGSGCARAAGGPTGAGVASEHWPAPRSRAVGASIGRRGFLLGGYLSLSMGDAWVLQWRGSSTPPRAVRAPIRGLSALFQRRSSCASAPCLGGVLLHGGHIEDRGRSFHHFDDWILIRPDLSEANATPIELPHASEGAAPSTSTARSVSWDPT